MAQDHNDIYSIVERLRLIEADLSPTSTKNGLTPQQKSVPQLPALFKPKSISVLTAKKDPKHPMAGYAVGADESADPIVNRSGHNALRSRDDYLDKLNHLETLYKQVDIGDRPAVQDRMAELNKAAQIKGFVEGTENSLTVLEAEVAEDVLEKVKSSFQDFIKQAEQSIDKEVQQKKKEDTDLKSKNRKDRDLTVKATPVAEDPTQEEPAQPAMVVVSTESAPVKTMTLKDGMICEIHGNERDGFEIRRGDRSLPTRFKDIAQAEMALEMFMARQQLKDESQDYLDEE
jgi:hypothetical protein